MCPHSSALAMDGRSVMITTYHCMDSGGVLEVYHVRLCAYGKQVTGSHISDQPGSWQSATSHWPRTPDPLSGRKSRRERIICD